MNSVKRAAYYAVCTLEAMLIAFVSLVALVNVVMLFQHRVMNAPVPTVFGYSYVNILSGSMEPTLSMGDLAVCKQQDSYGVGDAVLYQDGEYLVLHRIVEVKEDGSLVMRGDANNVDDDTVIHQNNIYGRLAFSFNGLGNTIAYVSTLTGAFWTVLSALLVYLAMEISKDLLRGSIRPEDDEEEDEQDEVIEGEATEVETEAENENAQEQEENPETKEE